MSRARSLADISRLRLLAEYTSASSVTPQNPRYRLIRLRSQLYSSCFFRHKFASCFPWLGNRSSQSDVTENTSNSVPYASNTKAFTRSPSSSNEASLGELDGLSLLHGHDHLCCELQSIHNLASTFGNQDCLTKQFEIVAGRRNAQRKLGKPLGGSVKRAGHLDLNCSDFEFAGTNRGEKMTREAAAQGDQLIFASDGPFIGTSPVYGTIHQHGV